MLLLGNLKIASPLVLAPLAGISDLPFRLINRSFGCGLAFTEMISSSALSHKNKNTLKMLSTNTNDRPLGVQILGNDPELIKKSLEIISGYAFDIIDFNAACPVSKVISRGEGAGLLKEPLRLQELLEIIVKNSSVPVTVKIRSGWDELSVNAVDIALRAEDAGVKGIFIHGRTKTQGYAGGVDYDIIRRVKQSVNIPVIASGDALSPNLIKKLFDETGCDGAAVARGSFGNPWIWKETASYLKNGKIPCRPAVHEIVQVMKKHLALNVEFHGERTGVMLFRKFFAWYTKGMCIKELKQMAFSAVTWDEMMGMIDRVQGLSYVRNDLAYVEESL
ncbi:MAG: tRNA dihydrouridine synthase DusB [Nitrospirae bacterium]|nr:tRNA dihydrouridine synthase DusB [Nitrospirota bacterium]